MKLFDNLRSFIMYKSYFNKRCDDKNYFLMFFYSLFIFIFLSSTLTISAYGSTDSENSKPPLSIGLSSGNITFYDSASVNSDYFNQSTEYIVISNTGRDDVDVSFYMSKDNSPDHYSLSFFTLSEDSVFLNSGNSFNLSISLNLSEYFRNVDKTETYIETGNLAESYKLDDFSDIKLHILYKPGNSSSMSAGFRVPLYIDFSNFNSEHEKEDKGTKEKPNFKAGSAGGIYTSENDVKDDSKYELENISNYNYEDVFEDENEKIKKQTTDFSLLSSFKRTLESYPLYAVSITLLISIIIITAVILLLLYKYKSKYEKER